VAEAAGVQAGIVTSPTFVLFMNMLASSDFPFRRVPHAREDEFLASGPEEYFSREGWSFMNGPTEFRISFARSAGNLDGNLWTNPRVA